MKNYNVHIEINECVSVDFTVQGPELSEAQYKAVEEAINLGYDPDDITDVSELCPKCGEKLTLDKETYKYVCSNSCNEAEESNEEAKKEKIEKQAKKFLYAEIRERCGGDCSNPEEYISDFFWLNNCLYARIDRLKDVNVIATLGKGLLV